MVSSSPLCEFDEQELHAAVRSDGRSQTQIAKDAKVDKKTLARAMKGLPVRRLAAQRIAGELKRSLSELLKPSSIPELPNQATTLISLVGESLTGEYNIESTWTASNRALATVTAEAYPQNAEALVSKINSARGVGYWSDAETPKVCWKFLKQTPRHPGLKSAMRQLESSLKSRTESTTASGLSELIETLEIEDSVEEALSELRKCGAHILAVTLFIELSPGLGYEENLDWHTYTVPVAIVAPVSIDFAEVEYRSVIENPEGTDPAGEIYYPKTYAST